MNTLTQNPQIPVEPILSFERDVKPLHLSPNCIALKANGYNRWVFQFIEMFQSKGYLYDHPIQYWSFSKEDQGIIASCKSATHQLLFARWCDIGIDHFQDFSDLEFHLVNHSCFTLNEEQPLMRRASA